MSHQNRRQSFTADSGEPAPRGSRLGRIILIGFAVALVATAAFISSAASANLPDAEFAPFKEKTLAADFAIQVDPTNVSVCKLDDAVYNIQVQALGGFTDTVTLNLSDEPDHTDVTFFPNPIVDPYTSTLTIVTSQPTDAGSYEMEISGATLTTTHTTTVGLEVFDGAPGTVTLTSPSDDATDVSLTPLLVWLTATQAVSYTIQVDDDNAFGSIDYTATVTTTEHTVGASLAEDTMYYWRVRGVNICDPGSYSDAFSFTTLANPSIDSTPASIDESIIVNAVVTNTLTITNTGTGNLIWTIEESASGSCPATGGIDWVTLSDTSGSAGAGQSDEVDVVFDAEGMATGDYSGALCINSNDASIPVVTLPLDMSVTDFTVSADPSTQSICMPDDAVYSVDVGSVNGFIDTVMLSLTGNPSGTTVDFSPSTANAPYTSELTIGSTGAGTVGSYDMEITGLSTPTSHTAAVHLELRDVPPAVTLISPPNGAINAPLKPLLEWQAAVDVIDYTVDVDGDPGFGSIDYTATVIDTEHKVGVYLDPESKYYWRVRADNACGTGSYSTVFSFTTKEAPAVLLVDDDDNIPDVQPIYAATLDTFFGIEGYDVWDTLNSDNEPDAEYLSFYDVVIWFTGAEFDQPAGPGAEGEAALSTWLDSSGCLLISSPDYHYAKGLTPFMNEYLGVELVIDDTGQKFLTGVNTVFDGLGPYTMDYDSLFTDYSDEIFPSDTAEVSFTGTNPNGSGRPAGVNNLGNTYATTYLGYPWEAIKSAGGREEVFTAFYDWCDSRTAWYTMYLPLLQGG